MPSEDVDDSKVVEDVHVSFKTPSIMEDISVGFDIPIIDGDYASYEGDSEVVDVKIESGTLLDVNAHAHDINELVPKLSV